MFRHLQASAKQIVLLANMRCGGPNLRFASVSDLKRSRVHRTRAEFERQLTVGATDHSGSFRATDHIVRAHGQASNSCRFSSGVLRLCCQLQHQ